MDGSVIIYSSAEKVLTDLRNKIDDLEIKYFGRFHIKPIYDDVHKYIIVIDVIACLQIYNLIAKYSLIHTVLTIFCMIS